MRVPSVPFGRCLLIASALGAVALACQAPEALFRDGGTSSTGTGGITGTGGMGNRAGTTGTGGVTGNGGVTGTGGIGGNRTGTGGMGGTGGNPTGAAGSGGTAGAGGTGGAPPCTTCMVELQYQCQEGTSLSTSHFILKLINNGNVSYPLTDVKIRYWYAADTGSAATQVNECYYASPPLTDCSQVTRTVVEIPVRGGTTNFYDEIGFTGTGMLNSFLAGANTIDQINLALHYVNYPQTFNPTDDYSWTCAAGTAFADNTKMTVYIAGVLAWGTEP
jgi:hypothetical protein